MATESGRDETGGPGNETGDKTAATGGVMYADEGPYTIDVRHVENMVGTTREASDGDRVRRGRLVTNETTVTVGVMYTDEGEL